MKKIIKVSTIAALVLVTTACASNKEALETARNAEAKADQAIATANEAKATALATQEQLDRMFKKSRYK